MSKQMTVRVSDSATQHIDALVDEGTFTSRASYVAWLVEREAQRLDARREILQMRQDGMPLENPDLVGMHERLKRRQLGHLD